MSDQHRWGIGSNQHQKRPGSQRTGRNRTSPDLPDGAFPDTVMADAREALLDILQILRAHADGIVVVGAQAVHEHTAGTDITATSTIDADAMIDPSLIAQGEPIQSALEDAGFVLASNARPGIYLHPRTGTTVDLLCPEAVAGPGTRAARIAGQSKQAIGRAAGLELAMVDHRMTTLSSLNGSGRSMDALIAGHASLLCAKAYKIAERYADTLAGKADRVKPKDAADVWRLMRLSDPGTVRATFDLHAEHEIIGSSVRLGKAHLNTIFTDDGPGAGLAARALGDHNPTEVREFIADWMAAFNS